MADLSKFTEYAKSFFLQRAAGYCFIILASLFVLCPLGVLQTEFDDNCLLYSEVHYELFNKSVGGMVVWRMKFGPQSVCQYNLAVSAIFSLIYALVMVLGYIFLYIRDREKNEIDLGQIAFLVHGVLEVVVVVLMLVSACTISHGFTTLCDQFTDTGLRGYTVDSCSHVQTHNWRGYDATNFFVCLAVATAGSWFQFIFWLLQTVFVLWKLWRLNMLPVLPEWMKRGSSA
ncbi:transmembrane protein 179-like [Littorina saxatilis]|uniref:Uncharacterized protein n=1 Tax=Littorina saxatilis TaxID=31220 RepID=A0AAN9BF40_9CAEN